jgi:predicted bacteriocin transport accessory protein
MKKNKMPIIIAIIVVIFALFIVLIKVNNSNDIEGKTVAEWAEDVKKEKVVTVIGLTTCTHCQEYKPQIISLAKRRGFNLYFFEVDTLSEEDQKTLTTTYDLADYTDRVPFTFIIDKGEYVTGRTGFSNINDMTEYLQEYNVIKN